jgi:glucose-1-phosphate adenylyltransferase
MSMTNAEASAVRSTYAVVLAGGRGSRLKQLTDERAKPALPFGGEMRIIDFTLSNCVNSGIRRIGVLTQYKSQSLIRHVTRGWGFLDAGLDEFVDIVPAQQQTGEGWYSGTANAVYQNLGMLRNAAVKHVLVLAGDHVYKMDYGRLIAEHMRRGADVTVSCIDVPLAQAGAFGVVSAEADGRVRAFDEKPLHPPALPDRPECARASMGIYVFDAAFLCSELCRDAVDPRSCHDFGGDILPRAVAHARVFAHDFAESCADRGDAAPYWRDVGTLDAYWEANLDLTRPQPALDLYDERWLIRSLQHQLPPAKFVFDAEGRRGTAIDSLVGGGCVVSGATVRRSVLFSRVRIGEGSVVEDSLLLPGAVLGRNVVVRRAIVDARCVLPDGIRIGVHPVEDRARFTVTDSGVTLVTASMLGPCS